MASKQTRNTLAALVIGGATIPALSGCGEVLIAGAILESSRARNQANLQAARAALPRPEIPSWANNSPTYSKNKLGFSVSNKNQRFDATLSIYDEGLFVDSPSGGWIALPYTYVREATPFRWKGLGSAFGNPDQLNVRDSTGQYRTVLFKSGDRELDFYAYEINERARQAKAR